jgi:hypothetical protein
VDISHRNVGDVLDLPRRDAELLLAEGWARPEPDQDSEADQQGDRGSSSVNPAS